MPTITNPILPGFNPDPSIVRAGDDYYIATSTFEWYGGVQIHHSRDLVHWRLCAHALTRKTQLDMIGNPDSCGIWAPCLSYDRGMFYLIYTDVKTLNCEFKDTPNYLVTARNITGPWSEPVFLNASGFDPSLFHDDDGRKWLVNMVWDHRKNKNTFGGILLQEYSADERRLSGPIKNIFPGAIGATEGPHLYKKNGYYYLMTAEGGTGYNHAVTVARSKNIDGPYELDPQNPILTSAHKPELELQKAGHASLVHTQSDEWYLAHLCSRPVGPHKRSILGRETAIQKCIWTDDGWLRLECGGNSPRLTAPAPNITPQAFDKEPVRDDFDAERLSPHFATLRELPDITWLSLSERRSHLRLYGRQSPCSRHQQSMVARRVQSLNVNVHAGLEFAPRTFQQMAGLICFYNVENWMYLRVSHDETLGKCLNIIVNDNNKYDEMLDSDSALPPDTPLHLGVKWRGETLQFEYSTGLDKWHDIGPALDATKISDDYVNGGAFTGAFVGMCCQDLTGQGLHADFDYFEYEEI